MFDIEVGQRWTHKMTDLVFHVALLEEDSVLLEPETGGQEITLTRELLMQEFWSPSVRRNPGKKQRDIKPGKIRRGLRR